MKRPVVFLYACCVVAGTCVAAGASCAGRTSGDPSAQAPSSRVVDSVQNAAAEQSRSSATQGVTFTEAERNRYARVEQMIQARFAGVQVVPRAGGFAIQIRGTGSFTSSNDPLVLVDGVTRGVSDIGKLNPKEVERIQIVKDAAAAYYGVRGANGVILITTRRGP